MFVGYPFSVALKQKGDKNMKLFNISVVRGFYHDFVFALAAIAPDIDFPVALYCKKFPAFAPLLVSARLHYCPTPRILPSQLSKDVILTLFSAIVRA